MIGWSARRTLPSPLRALAYRAFARAVGANLAETELALSEYPSLGDFFARRLRDGSRPIDTDPDAIIAPCDGAIAACGTATGGTLVQAKGREYTLTELLDDAPLAARLIGGAYATIYLSPRDYHRVHAPLSGRIVAYELIPGALWPVNPRIANRRDGLLARNERVVIHLATSVGEVALVMVGAAGVGNIVLSHGLSSAALRRGLHEPRRIEVDQPVERGDELGAFRLGSTVVLVFPGTVSFDALSVGDVLRFGERIGSAR